MDSDDDWLSHDAHDGPEQHTGGALERQFHTIGFREGLTTEYEQTLQEGFNVGFANGYTVGWGEAQLLGAVTALIDVLTPAAGSGTGAGAPGAPGAAGAPGARAPAPVRLRLSKDRSDAAEAMSALRAIATAIEQRLAQSAGIVVGQSGDSILGPGSSHRDGGAGGGCVSDAVAGGEIEGDVDGRSGDVRGSAGAALISEREAVVAVLRRLGLQESILPHA